MFEKENSEYLPKGYDEWSQKDLNQRIMELYDHIQQVTLQNLKLVEQNNQLETQIKTIDVVLKTQSSKSCRMSINTLTEPYSQESVQQKYQTLLEEHKQLENRVFYIEELIYSKHKNENRMAKKPVSMLKSTASSKTLTFNSKKHSQKGSYDCGTLRCSMKQQFTKRSRFG